MSENSSDLELLARIIEGTATTVHDSAVSQVGQYAFSGMSALAEVSFPNAKTAGQYCFTNCRDLVSAYLPNITNAGSFAFSSCSALTDLDVSALAYVNQGVFSECSALVSVELPAATTLNSGAFNKCTSLRKVTLPAGPAIYNDVFAQCSNLVELHLEGVSKVPYLAAKSAFWYTPIGGSSSVAGQYGSIYVPASLYDAFLSASNWSDFASRIVSVAEEG